MDEDILVMGKGTNKVEIDLMQPIDPEKAPKVHVPTLNHIGLWVDDLHKAVDELTAMDVRFTPGGIRKGAGEFFFLLFAACLIFLFLESLRNMIIICILPSVFLLLAITYELAAL